MKRIIRIILSPLVFLMFLACIIIVPIGLLVSWMGFCYFWLSLIQDNPEVDTKESLQMMVTIIMLPYQETIDFINS